MENSSSRKPEQSTCLSKLLKIIMGPKHWDFKILNPSDSNV